MKPGKHIVIFSHGFGVGKNDRGLFTDIASSLPGVEAVLFDYNKIDTESHTMTVRPFSEQSELLRRITEEQRRLNPDATIDMVCHSQGSRVAAMTELQGVRKIILIAPPTDSGIDRMLERYRNMPGVEINPGGITRFPRSDGSTTIVPAAYFAERIGEKEPIESYNELAKRAELIIINANQDTVLGKVLWDGLNPDIQVISLDGNHDFSGPAREALVSRLSNIILG